MRRVLHNRVDKCCQNVDIHARPAAGGAKQYIYSCSMLGPGERARDIAARKCLAHGQAILDYMNSEELAANLFRVTQTAARIRREGIQGKSAANQTHHDVGRKVRQTIQELGGTMPEDLPTPTESIKRVERRTQRALQPRQQPTLLPAEPPDA
ncbi:MAG TPA: hypothetical protein VID73_01335 [Ktedonobacterales bacterium]